MAEAILILACYHLLFFWKQYTEPFKQATSEVISTFFPYWIYQGRHGNGDDNIYYYHPRCIPFLSTFYAPSFVTAFISRFLGLDNSFKLFNLLVNSHYLLGSILSFILIRGWAPEPIALFGSLTLTYAAFMLKIQPCIVYTVNWLPGCLLPGPLGALSIGMALLGGYWPYCVYFLPVAFVAQWIWYGNIWWPLVGLIIALPQIIPFLWYLPKSVRAKKTGNPGKTGRVPIWRLWNLVWPDSYTTYVNGLLSQETALSIGFIPLLFIWFSQSGAWWLVLGSILMMIGIVPTIGRIPARASHLFLFGLVWLAASGLTRRFNLTGTNEAALWVIFILQAFMLLANRQQLSYWPFTEWWKRPSKIWGARPGQTGSRSVYNAGFPYFTGYLTETKTPGYTGGFALQRMHDKYGIRDSNGARISKEEELKWLTHQS